MAHPNEDLLRRGYAAFTGDYRGHEAVMGFFPLG
jgi:hypothetical protein